MSQAEQTIDNKIVFFIPIKNRSILKLILYTNVVIYFIKVFIGNLFSKRKINEFMGHVTR